MIEDVSHCDRKVASVPVAKFPYENVVDGGKQEAF